MFRRRNEDPAGGEDSGKQANSDQAGALKPGRLAGAAAEPKPQFRPEIPRRVTEIPGAPRPAYGVMDTDDTKKLIVGREICLSGEITACEKLVVEGRVEANLSDSRIIDISATGYFKGSAEVEEAVISGEFQGTLKVRGRLLVRATGRVTGDIRYGELEIERGGRISGEIDEVGAAPRAAAEPAATTAVMAAEAD